MSVSPDIDINCVGGGGGKRVNPPPTFFLHKNRFFLLLGCRRQNNKNWMRIGERGVCMYVCMYVYKGLVQAKLQPLSMFTPS